MYRLTLAVALLATLPARAEDTAPARHTADLVYGHKSGMALTMDVFEPAERNGSGIIQIQSGGWVSSHSNLRAHPVFLSRGYTVFVVMHGSQPKFQIPEAVEDVQRAVRFVRLNAARFGVDPDKLAVTGSSAGCHLSLMLAAQGGPGPADAKDEVERASGAVAAVGCFFPPTDFLNYGRAGEIAVGVGVLRDFRQAFGARADDPDERRVYGREISPIYFVTKKLPPTLIIHGDADRLVPIQQAESFVARAKGVGAKARLIVKSGKGHGWPELDADRASIADWFDEHLRGHRPRAR